MSQSQVRKTPPRPGSRRSERLSTRRLDLNVDSEDDDFQHKGKNADDREWRPEPVQDSLLSTPASNIDAIGTQLSKRVKKRVEEAAEAAGTGRRCPLTNYDGPDWLIQHSHVVPRSLANKLTLIRKLEWSWGCYEGTLNLDSSRNIMKLHALCHLLIDRGHVLTLVPPLTAVMAVKEDAVILQDHPNRPTAKRKHFLDVLPSSESWNYRVLSLKQIEGYPIVRKLPNGGFETLSLDQLPRIQITSHIHPYFAIFAAGSHFAEADVTTDDFTDEEEKLLFTTISALYTQWTTCTPPPWFGNLQQNPPPKNPHDKRPVLLSPSAIINEEKLSDGELSPSTRALQTKQSKSSLQTRVSRDAKGKSKSASFHCSGLAKGKAKASETTSILMESASRSEFGDLKSRSNARFPLSTEPPVHGSSNTSGSVVSLLAMGPPPSILSDVGSLTSATPEISTRPGKRARPDDAYEHSAGSTSHFNVPASHSTQSVISNLLSNPTVMEAALDQFLKQILKPDGSAEYCLDGVEGTLTFTPRSSKTSGSNSHETKAGPLLQRD